MRTRHQIQGKLKNITLENTKEYIETQGITVETGIVYRIYTCGCITKQDDDPDRRVYFKGVEGRQRACPNHPGKMIHKYKLCQCGKEQISIKLHQSVKCAACYWVTNKPKKFSRNSNSLWDREPEKRKIMPYIPPPEEKKLGITLLSLIETRGISREKKRLHDKVLDMMCWKEEQRRRSLIGAGYE